MKYKESESIIRKNMTKKSVSQNFNSNVLTAIRFHNRLLL